MITKHLGDLFDVLPTLAEHSVDAVITDPPYGIGYAGKQWDTFAPEKLAQNETKRFRQVDGRKGVGKPKPAQPQALAGDAL